MFRRLLIVGLLCAVPLGAFGFSLLGPYEPWMSVSNGYAKQGDLGGPVRLGHEYRWNLPVITYGFSPAFVQHFGSNGVRAVDAAVRILNNVPAASRIRLEHFPPSSTRTNLEAEAGGLHDFKSLAMSHLLYQVGLAPSTRHVWIIRDRTNHHLYPYIVTQRNYDPLTLKLTRTVNNVEYNYAAWEIQTGVVDAEEVPRDPCCTTGFTAVTDNVLWPGRFYTGLTRDDVGGLRYLYSRSNINLEKLPSSVTTAWFSKPPRINVALRPGVEKLTFSKLTWNPGTKRFNPVTQRFTLGYYDRGVLRKQNLRRVVTRPDILFDAQPLTPTKVTWGTNVYFYPTAVAASTAARWQNLSHLSGRAAYGPGILTPGARIVFDSTPPLPRSPFYYSRWASFDGSTNAPILFPPTFEDP